MKPFSDEEAGEIPLKMAESGIVNSPRLYSLLVRQGETDHD